jgi:hypothetical protein
MSSQLTLPQPCLPHPRLAFKETGQTNVKAKKGQA